MAKSKSVFKILKTMNPKRQTKVKDIRVKTGLNKGQVQYALNHLIELGYIKRIKNGRYLITEEGLNFRSNYKVFIKETIKSNTDDITQCSLRKIKVLRALYSGRIVSPKAMSKRTGISPPDLQWVLPDMVKAGMINRVKRGSYQITDKGLKCIGKEPKNLPPVRQKEPEPDVSVITPTKHLPKYEPEQQKEEPPKLKTIDIDDLEVKDLKQLSKMSNISEVALFRVLNSLHKKAGRIKDVVIDTDYSRNYVKKIVKVLQVFKMVLSPSYGLYMTSSNGETLLYKHTSKDTYLDETTEPTKTASGPCPGKPTLSQPSEEQMKKHDLTMCQECGYWHPRDKPSESLGDSTASQSAIDINLSNPPKFDWNNWNFPPGQIREEFQKQEQKTRREPIYEKLLPGEMLVLEKGVDEFGPYIAVISNVDGKLKTYRRHIKFEVDGDR